MIIDNGRRGRLIIDKVFDGWAGVQGNRVSFLPAPGAARPNTVKGGMLDGRPVLLTTTKDALGPFWTARFTVIG